MDIEKLIEETFTAHEHDVPDEATVLAAARRRIHRRRLALSRPLAVAAGVAVVALAAAAVVTVARTGSTPDEAAPADKAQTAAPKTAPKPAVASLPMPFSLGWLPPGRVEYVVHRVNVGATSDAPDARPVYGGDYMITVTANGQVLGVNVQQMRTMPVDEAMFKSGPGRPVTINGRHGVESVHSDGPGGYELYLADPSGGSMYVNVDAQHDSTAPTQKLIDYGHRIAAHIRVPGDTTVTPVFGLRDLPGGQRICAFDVERGTTGFWVGTCTVMPPVVVHTGAPELPGAQPGRPVLGHATRHLDENGFRTLLVLGAVKGEPVAIAGRVPLNQLYAVADRLVLPH